MNIVSSMFDTDCRKSRPNSYLSLSLISFKVRFSPIVVVVVRNSVCLSALQLTIDN